MAKKKTTYGYQTIGSLIALLKKTVEETSYLDYNSPVMISDYNMSSFKYEFDVVPAFSQAHHTAGIGLFHSLNEEPVYVETTYDTESGEPFFKEEEEEKEDTAVMKFVKWYKK